MGHPMIDALVRAAVLLPVLALPACSLWAPRVEMADTAPIVVAAEPRPAAHGSIFQSASYRPLFEDYRARLAGDTLTVMINENRVNGMASDSRSVNLRELALAHSYDLHVSSVSANWTDGTINVHVRIDGLLPTDKEILLINNPYQCQFDAVV